MKLSSYKNLFPRLFKKPIRLKARGQVMPQLTIGMGTVIVAGALVTKDEASYKVVVGFLAMPIKKHFSDAISDRMQAIAWWHLGRAALKTSLLDVRILFVESFLEKHETLASRRFLMFHYHFNVIPGKPCSAKFDCLSVHIYIYAYAAQQH